MRRIRVALLLIVFSALARPARGATVGQVDALIQKAHAALRVESTDRAAKFRAAIKICREALELLEKVQGISDEMRDKKAAEIMSNIYWCRKMMPLDLSGRQLASKSTSKGAGSSQQSSGGGKTASAGKQKEFDKIAFDRAKAYASRHGDNLAGILLRYEGVAASYPRTKWGKKAAEMAGSARKKLQTARKTVFAARKAQIERLELDALLKALERDMAREKSASTRAQLRQLKKDVTALKALWKRVIKGLEGRQITMSEPLEEMGIDKEGWVRKGGPGGVEVSMGTRSATPTLMSWREFGATATVLLSEKLLNMKDREALEDLAVGATVTGNFMVAHAAFEKLVLMAPERVIAVVEYFERAQTGYSSSAEGSASLRFGEAKKLVRHRKFPEAMKIVEGLRRDLAKNSSLQEYLAEVNDFRRQTMRRHKVNGKGEPITAFEKRVRKVFGGDVKLDKETGAIEVVYDFAAKSQLRDWLMVHQYGQPARKGGWTIMKGKAYCLGGKPFLMWKFPISNFDIQADVTYEDEDKRVIICARMNKTKPFGVVAWCRYGRAKLTSYGLSYYGWYSSARFIWRPGEVASLRFIESRDSYLPFVLTVNGNHGVGGSADVPSPGPVAFGFEGGRGTVDNVVIKGKLDMKWFLQSTMGRKR